MLEDTLHEVVSDLISKNREESTEAAKLLFSRREKKKRAYLAYAGNKRYLIVGEESLYHLDIQQAIERFEGKTFDEMYLPYITPDNIQVF
jgi:hypothetical protein